MRGQILWMYFRISTIDVMLPWRPPIALKWVDRDQQKEIKGEQAKWTLETHSKCQTKPNRNKKHQKRQIEWGFWWIGKRRTDRRFVSHKHSLPFVLVTSVFCSKTAVWRLFQLISMHFVCIESDRSCDFECINMHVFMLLALKERRIWDGKLFWLDCLRSLADSWFTNSKGLWWLMIRSSFFFGISVILHENTQS